MALGERVRDCRMARNLKQEELAKLAGIPPTSFNRIEKNERKMTFEEAVRVAEILDVSLSVLAGVEIVPLPRDTRAQEIVNRCLRQGKNVRRRIEILVQDLQTLRVYK